MSGAFAEDPLVEQFMLAFQHMDQPKESLDIQVGSLNKRLLIQKPQDLAEVSRWILQSVRGCNNPCSIKIGKKSFIIETPALGEGERGIVFRLIDGKSSRILKISKPDIKSLAILRAESSTHSFWSSHATANFSVPARFTTHPLGLFSVMSEVRGEPLTETLFRLGFLQVDPVGGDIVVNKDLHHIQDTEVNKIWFAISDLIMIVKKNDSMKTSLSPNNIFITKSDDGKIASVSLIDFGIDGTGDSRYFDIKNFSDYLNLSAIKIKGYLAKPGFTKPILFTLQEEARRRYGIPSLYDEKIYRPLLEEAATKLVSPNTDVKQLTLSKILALPIPTAITLQIKADNIISVRPKVVADLTQSIIILNDILNKQAAGVVTVCLNEEVYKIKVPALGQGDRGTVYALEGRDEVIKIPKGNLASILTLMNESVGYNFWYAQALKSNEKFSVPKRSSLHPLGLFSVIKRDNGEPLTKMMVRYGLLTFNASTGEVQTHPEKIETMGLENKKKIENGILKILEIIHQNPEYGLSISPNNLHVNYADANKKIISDIVLIDVGLGNRNTSKFDAVHDMLSYLELSQNRLEKYIKVGYIDNELKALNHDGALKCSKIFAF